jgi:hypothetical protein
MGTYQAGTKTSRSALNWSLWVVVRPRGALGQTFNVVVTKLVLTHVAVVVMVYALCDASVASWVARIAPGPAAQLVDVPCQQDTARRAP